MNKAKVKKIYLSDKIYIKKKDVEDVDQLLSLYTYDNGDEFLSTISEDEDYYIVPSNSYHKLEWDEIDDQRNFVQMETPHEFVGKLRWEQQEVVDKFFARGRARSGILQAPCGWGKTFTGCEIISKNNTKTLIMVHTKLLFRQWIEELERQLPSAKIGKVGDGLFDVQDITVGIYKSVYNRRDELEEKFSTVLVDEAHLCPAEMFSTALNSLNAKIKIGISATPKRKRWKACIFSRLLFSIHSSGKRPKAATRPSSYDKTNRLPIPRIRSKTRLVAPVEQTLQ